MIDTPAWRELLAHHQRCSHLPMRARFAAEPERFARLSASACGLLLDYSKNRLGSDTMALLLALAQERGVAARRDAMFAGATVNHSERRAAMHVALRAASTARDATSVAIATTLQRMQAFVETVRGGRWTGHDGRAVRTVVHIGIGGSDLGPRLACEALAPCADDKIALRFVANVDAHELQAALRGLDAATTLFIVASKTFTTAETMQNAHGARAWALAQGVPATALARHFVAVSANAKAVHEFGLDPAQMFPLWDWVGGRFSLWSAVGLPLALLCGMDTLQQLHAGARAMDDHFRHAPLPANLPVLLALVGIWNINLLGQGALSIAPYHQLLARLPAHLQQLEMESNGKSVDEHGRPLRWATAPIIWGQAGTNAQHAYFQWLHQGTSGCPVDFIIAATSDVNDFAGAAVHQRALLANALAQGEALMRGKTHDEARAELAAGGLDAAEVERLAPHQVFPGNRPSNTIVLPRLDAHHLGALLALYEHKVMVQGVVWGIDSFDQWGVEWGKKIARGLTDDLALPVRAGAPQSLLDALRSGADGRLDPD